MSEKKSNKRFILGIAVAFLLPLSFYGITALLSRGKLHLPRYYVADSVKTIEKNGKMVNDTVFHHVSELTLTNQLGNVVSLNKDLQGKIIVVNTFFANCPTVCPRLSQNMALLQRAFRKNVKTKDGFDTVLQLVSITVNPEQDTPAALRVYADRYEANHDRWWFLTGDKGIIYNYIRHELHLAGGEENALAEDFIHSQSIVLLDANRHIRGYYNGLDTAAVARCADDIVLLTKEKHPKP